MIEIDLVLQIGAAIFVMGGAIISFFVMQKGQNMKISQLEIQIEKLEKKQSNATRLQIQTEKEIVSISEQLKHIVIMIEDLKNNGHP